MLTQLAHAARIVNANIALVVLVGLLTSVNASQVGVYGFLASIAALFFLRLAAYGNVTDLASGHSSSGATAHIKRNWLNYLVVTILLGLPFLLFKQLSGKFHFSYNVVLAGNTVLPALIEIVTVYVLPVVFLKRMGALSILAGLSFLFGHLRESALPLLLLCGMLVAKGGITYAAMQEPIGTGFMMVGVAYNVVIAYLSFIVFAVAVSILAGKRPQATEAL